MEELQQRKEAILGKLKDFKLEKKYISYIVYITLGIILYLSYHIRTLNLANLDYQYPLALDPFVVLRYVQTFIENGHMLAVDTLRYFPIGFNGMTEFTTVTYFSAFVYKVLHFFAPATMTIELAHILYPVVATLLATIFFFLLVNKLFNWKVGLVAAAFISVLPGYLYRTMAGFSDKEALALALIFLAFYLYVSAFKEKKWKLALPLGLAAGLISGLAQWTWGGGTMLFLIIGSWMIIETLLNKINVKDYLVYSLWFVPMAIFLMMVFPIRFSFGTFTTSFSTGLGTIGFFIATIHLLLFKLDLLKIKNKVSKKLPLGFASLGIAIVLAVLGVVVLWGPNFIIEKLIGLFLDMTNPFGQSRWALTVAEAHQPYFTDWVAQYSSKFVWLFFAGAILLFYETVKYLKKGKWLLTGLFALFILGFSLSRYSQGNPVWNGATDLALFIYVGSLVGFLVALGVLYLRTFYKDKENFLSLKKINRTHLFVLIWFFFMLFSARSAIRLVMLLAPIGSILVAYLSVYLVEFLWNVKNSALKVIGIVFVILIVGSMFYGFTEISINQAKSTYPSFTPQWQTATSWIESSTPEDSVFAHWWDYGYWVQTGANRATLSDGGNARGAINHWIGRHVLTAPSQIEALELLKANDATHLLMISDEIGKYPAYSSIGADCEYDRYSWITTFGLNQQQTTETRDGMQLVYTGGTAVDDGFTYQGKYYPGQNDGKAPGISGVSNPTGISGFVIETQINDEQQSFGQPQAVVFYNGEQTVIPVQCMYIQGEELVYSDNKNEDVIPGCLVIIPKVSGNKEYNPIGSSLWLSNDVWQSNFAQLYLLDKESNYFTKVYDDSDDGFNLMDYYGRIIGPLKIWEINYPSNLDVPEEYYGTNLIDECVNDV